MTITTYAGSGQSLATASSEAERRANDDLKARAGIEIVALTTTHSLIVYEPHSDPPQEYEFVITVAYQRRSK
jgi:hypothetical protein